MPHCAPSLSSLPPELIEEIIIFSTLLGDARTPSTLAQTCRRLCTLVYYQTNKHLWREMFLILFDDPRPALDLRVQGRAPQPQQLNPTNKCTGKSTNCLSGHDFSWEDEYKLRIWAESFILRRTRPPLSEPPSPHDASSDLPSTDAELYTLLDTLLRVVLTAAPLPNDELAILTSHCHIPNLSEPFPILSPLSLAAHTLPALVWGSRNTSWLARVLAHGLPRVLMVRLSALDENGEIDIQKKPVKWDGLLVKLVAQVGLMMPINSTTCFAERPDHAQVEHDDSDDRRETLDQEEAHDPSASGDDDSDFEPQPEGEGDEERERDIDSDEALGTPATTLQDNLRRLARLRIFNMSYLHPSRAFGPFLPLKTHHPSYSSPSAQNLGSGSVAEEEEVSLANTMLGSPSSTAVPPVPPIPDTHLDMASFGLSPLLDDVGRDNANDETGREGNLPTDHGPYSFLFFLRTCTPPAEDGCDPVASSVYPIEATSGPPAMYPPDIPGDQLPHFDWAWIAAARLVIELNLRDLLSMERHQGVLRAFLSLHGLRSCSAPVFPAAPPEAMAADKCEGEGGQTFKDGEGWDWAGVEGQWRCVIPSLLLGSYFVLKNNVGHR